MAPARSAPTSARWNSGRLSISSTTRSPRPTPRASSRRRPGGAVGVLRPGRRLVGVTHARRRRATTGSAVGRGPATAARSEPREDPVCSTKPREHVIHNRGWRTRSSGVEKPAEMGNTVRQSVPRRSLGPSREWASLRRLSSGRSRVHSLFHSRCPSLVAPHPRPLIPGPILPRQYGPARTSALRDPTLVGRRRRDSLRRTAAGRLSPSRAHHHPAHDHAAARHRGPTTDHARRRTPRRRPSPTSPRRSRRTRGCSTSSTRRCRSRRSKLAALKAQIDDTAQKLDATRNEIARLKALMKARAAYMYQHSNTPEAASFDIQHVVDITAGKKYAESATHTDGLKVDDLSEARRRARAAQASSSTSSRPRSSRNTTGSSTRSRRSSRS